MIMMSSLSPVGVADTGSDDPDDSPGSSPGLYGL